jgi:prepilin-type N-terminal cleavage/methylation domain-containing protein
LYVRGATGPSYTGNVGAVRTQRTAQHVESLGANVSPAGSDSERGFTVTEVMFVVVILGILVSISVLVFVAATERATAASCRASQRVLQGAIQSYELEDGSRPTTLTDVAPLVRQSGQLGRCPADETVVYDYDPVTGEVSCDLHP